MSGISVGYLFYGATPCLVSTRAVLLVPGEETEAKVVERIPLPDCRLIRTGEYGKPAISLRTCCAIAGTEAGFESTPETKCNYSVHVVPPSYFPVPDFGGPRLS
eukprot:3630835-Rhodomonas_salina.1